MKLLPPAIAGGLDNIRLDLAHGPQGPVEKGWRTVAMPIVPLPGEITKIGGDVLRVVERGFEIEADVTVIRLFVARLNSAIVPAAPGAVHAFGRPQ